MIILSCVIGYSQKQINVHLAYNASTKIYLYTFDGFNKTLADSGITNEEGKVTLISPKNYKGMGIVSLENAGDIFVVLGEKNVDINMKTLQDYYNPRIQSKENVLFDELMLKHQKNKKILFGLYWLKPLYEGENDKSENFIIHEIDSIEKVEKGLIAELPESMYISYYLPLRWYVESIPGSLQGTGEKIPVLINDFLKIDFSDDRIWHSGLLNGLLENYLIMCESAGVNSPQFDSVYTLVNSATDFIFQTIKGDPEKTNEMAGYLFKLYEKRSLFPCAEYLSLYFLEDTENYCLITDKLNRQMEQYRVMRKGNPSPDIVFNDPLDKYNKLSEIDSYYTLVFFWASWCGHCMKELPKLLALNDKLVENSIQVLTVSLDTDEKDFKEAIQYYPWLNYCDFKSWDGNAAKNFYVYATPTIYLINNNTGSIVIKLADGRQLEAFIDQGYLNNMLGTKK